MNDRLDSQQIARIHAAPIQLVLAATGGGSSAISQLLRIPGGSQTVLEALVPYADQSLVDFLGARPEHFCSERTARAMAMAAFWRARKLAAARADSDSPALERACLGVGITASLASNRPKRGPHRIYVATQTAAETAVAALELTKDVRSRAQEEDVATQLALNCIARVAGFSDALDLELLAGENVHVSATSAPPEWQQLLLGETSSLALGRGANLPTSPRVVFPGAFDPLHDGHREMARVAAQILGAPVEFELSIENVDKPPLDYQEIAERSDQFPGYAPLWLTRAPTFVRKAQLFPAATFLVGADTIERIAAPRYYAGGEPACAAAIEEIGQLGCRFLVFGRQSPAGFETLDNLALPSSLRQLCTGVAEPQFRSDLSSTAIRRTR